VRAAVLVGLVAFVVFESVVTWTPGSWSYDLAPQAYRFVAEQPDVDTIAEWPLQPTSNDPDHKYLTYVPVHGKKLVNVLEDQSRPDQVARGIYGLADAETATVLRRLGADLVLVHRDVATAEVPAADFEKVASFSYAGDVAVNPTLRRRASRWAYLSPTYDVDVYRLRPGPVAAAAIAVGPGFHGPEGDGAGTSSRWMEQDGRLTVVGFDRGVRSATIAFDVSSAGGSPRTLRLTQGGAVLFSETVSEARRVEVQVRVGVPVILHATPGPVRPAADERRLSVIVSGLDVVSTP
jgi:hypothetical protein